MTMFIGRKLQPPEHLVLGFSQIGSAKLVVCFGSGLGDEVLCLKCLKLYCIRPTAGSLHNQLQRQITITIVIYPDLCNDKAGFIFTDLSCAYLDYFHFG